MSYENCGSQIVDTKLCDACETHADAGLEKTLSDSISLAVIMAVLTAVIILVYGFKDEHGMTTSFPTIGLSVVVCGFKWILEIKNQIQWKEKEAREKAEGSDQYDL